ncbi:hypothetical protein AGMMS49944_13520 [Spirochaetia bacterium]|nr:hypothetical protein AGMMS49944_13520 [Spirochaetia bacterium]
MRILVAVSSYSLPEDKGTGFFVRGRNIYYKLNGIDVTVLNFNAKNDYIRDQISVYSLRTFKEKLIHEHFDILVCHAPNIRNCYFFLKKFNKKFEKIVFIFHGHEILNINKVYPAPYSYLKQSYLKKIFIGFYDNMKFTLWHYYYQKLVFKSHFVFVSNWLFNAFIKWIKIPPAIIQKKCMIIPNSVGFVFEHENYDINAKKNYDFITIRSVLDGSTYCIDIVNQLAKNNPQFSFMVIGKGKYFDYNEKAKNLTLVNKNLEHKEIISFLNNSRCALMPTRQDTHGLMACEMATFGIPVITSDIPVCREVFSSFNNVKFIDNDVTSISLNTFIVELERDLPYKKNDTFLSTNTTQKEIELFNKIVDVNKCTIL